MRFVVSCVKQTVIFAVMAVLSVGFLFFVHFCHSATMSLASWPLTQQSYQNSVKETDRSAWKGVGYNDTSGLLWFLHITDLHISKFRSPERTRDLQQLCLFVKDSLRPKVVVVTGDLTDAKVSSPSYYISQSAEFVFKNSAHSDPLVLDCGKHRV